MTHIHFLHSHLAGFSFGEGVFVFDQLKIGTELTLQPEPENRYDANAVALYFDKYKLGYLPRSTNREISKFLNAGYTDLFTVKINRISPDQEPENQIGITIFLKQKPQKKK